ACREGRMRDEVGGGVCINRRPSDERIVAAELKRQEHIRAARKLAVNERAGLRRSGEKHAVQSLRIEHRSAGFVGALKQRQNAIRQTCLLPGLDHQRAYARRELAWLEEDAIAGEQRGNDMAIRQMAGKIERTKDAEHAMGMMRKCGDAKSVGLLLGAGAFSLCADRNLDL